MRDEQVVRGAGVGHDDTQLVAEPHRVQRAEHLRPRVHRQLRARAEERERPWRAVSAPRAVSMGRRRTEDGQARRPWGQRPPAQGLQEAARRVEQRTDEGDEGREHRDGAEPMHSRHNSSSSGASERRSRARTHPGPPICYAGEQLCPRAGAGVHSYVPAVGQRIH